MKSLTSIITLVLLLCLSFACSKKESLDNEDTDEVTTTDTTTGNIPKSLQGQWIYVHSGKEVWLGTTTQLTHTKVNDNLLQVTDESGDIMYLIRAGIGNVRTKGRISSMGTSASSSEGPAKALHSITGIGGINVILRNIIDENVVVETTTESDGSFIIDSSRNDDTPETIPSGTYQITAEDEQDGSVEAEVMVEGDTTDLGIFTLVEGNLYNFKTELVDNEIIYYGSKDGSREYEKTLRIHNIGSQQVTGLNFTITSDDSDVRSLSYENVLGGMEPGKYLEIPITINFKRPSSDKDVRVMVTIRDVYNRTWTDYITMKLCSHIQLKIYVKGSKHGVNGYLITPGHTLIELNAGSWSWSSINVPHSPGEYYEMVLANPSINSETPYIIGVGRTVDDSVADTFTETAINEPDNDSASATDLGLYDYMVSYLHAGDIDYYRFVFNEERRPFEPVIAGAVDTPGPASHIAISGNYAYVTDDSDGLQVIDIINPNNPVIAGAVDTPGSAGHIAISGNYAYVADGSKGLQIIDIINPTDPVIAGAVDTPGSAGHIAISGNYAYVTDGSKGLQVIDIINPNDPVIAGSVDTPGSASSIAISGNYAYIADGSKGLQVIDIVNSTDPVIAGSVDTPGSASSVAISGNYAYVTAGSYGLQVIQLE